MEIVPIILSTTISYWESLNVSVYVKQMESCSNPASRGKMFRSSKETMRDSCFSTESLVRIAQTYNRLHPTSPSVIPDDVIAAVSGKRHTKQARMLLVKAVRTAFLDKCSKNLLPHHHDSCILQTKVGESLVHSLPDEEASAPPPKAPNNELLKNKPWNTYEVNEAMAHVERKHPHFIFLETTPIDFASTDELGRCTVSELCRFDIRNIVKRGKTAFGIVFNTHTHDKPGGHWICIYCCLLTGRMCYYDSYGFLPENEIIEFMRSVASQYQQVYGKKMTLLYNDYPNQTGGIECGTFCIVFLDFMATHGDLRKAVTTIRDSTNVNRLRRWILSPSFSDA